MKFLFSRYDYPAAIDYILQTTEEKDLYFVSFSMGSTHYFMMLSELPEYNAKIKAGFALGPAVFIGDDLMRRAKPIFEILLGLMDWLEINEFFPKALADLNHYTCTKDQTHAYYCHKLWNLIANTDVEDMDLRTTLTQMTNVPSQISRRIPLCNVD